MNLIRKGPPPPALVTYAQSRDASTAPPSPARYDGPGFQQVKPAVRAALVEQQRGVCCYCTGPIAATEAQMKIEHRVPQRGPSGDATRDLDWSNLFGACRGELRDSKGGTTLHCDSSKGDLPLALDPTNPAHIAAVGYEGNGRVTSTRAEHQCELDQVLRLNCEGLRERRARALAELKRGLASRYPGRAFPEGALSKLLAQLREPPGPLRPYSGFLVWWVERALRRTKGAGPAGG